MKNCKLFGIAALLLASLTAWTADATKPRATIVDDPTPAPVVVPAPAPVVVAPAPAPQTVRIEVVQVPATVTPIATTPPASIPSPVDASKTVPATTTPPAPVPVVTFSQIETAVESAVAKYKAVQTSAPTAAWYTDLLQALLAGALSLGAVAITWIGKKIHDVVEASSLAAADKAAIEALSAGVTSAENTLYADFAARNADGTIDAADAAALRTHALQVAKDVATGPGLAALQTMALPRITDLIERIVANKQAVQATANPAPVPVVVAPALASAVPPSKTA